MTDNATLCRFSVCPHDTAKNQVAWFTLNTYLQRKLDVRMRFEPQDNLLAEREFVLSTPHNLVYANPYSAHCFAEQGFIPIARPAGVNDEAFLIARTEFDLASAARPIRIASATDKLIVHPLGMTLLPELGLNADDVVFNMCGNHMNAVKSVLNGTDQMGFVFNETWAGLNNSTRTAFKVLGETKNGMAFHCFMVGPAWGGEVARVQAALCGMADDPSGKTILDELGFHALEPIDVSALEKLKTLIS